jgi:ATP-dependent Clp protease, protease subunit
MVGLMRGIKGGKKVCMPAGKWMVGDGKMDGKQDFSFRPLVRILESADNEQRTENLMAEKEKKETAPDVLSDKFLQTRSILLSGNIDKESAEKVIKQMLILEADGDGPIRIFINSPGGDVEAGFAIFDMARFIKNEVIMIGMGLVASAAALVLLAVPAERRLGLPNSSYLIHQPMSQMEGVATNIEIYTKQLEKIRDNINAIISEETKQPIEIVRKDTDRDYWLGAKEAQKYGLISRIVVNRQEIL